MNIWQGADPIWRDTVELRIGELALRDWLKLKVCLTSVNEPHLPEL